MTMRTEKTSLPMTVGFINAPATTQVVAFTTNGGTPFRKNYAGIGYTYDAARDAFIPPKPYNSWVLNEDTCLWDAPVAMPADAGTGEPPKRYTWDEATTSWVEIEE
jgi:hypothetical protein